MERVEIELFLKLFNRNGYVMDFNTCKFDSFTQKSVGTALCGKYQCSKGKSLEAFCSEASAQDVEKLLFDLFEYYENVYKNDSDNDREHSVYRRCKQIFERNRNAVEIAVPAITCVNCMYIKDVAQRAVRDVRNGEYDSAITKCRTLLEEVFCYVIEQKGETPSDKGDIKKLYRHVRDLYRMHYDEEMDKRTKELLSGLDKIIDAIKEMRDKDSDAHGVGKKRINISEHHARLFVNSSLVVADFILSVSDRHMTVA